MVTYPIQGNFICQLNKVYLGLLASEDNWCDEKVLEILKIIKVEVITVSDKCMKLLILSWILSPIYILQKVFHPQEHIHIFVHSIWLKSFLTLFTWPTSREVDLLFFCVCVCVNRISRMDENCICSHFLHKGLW